MLFSLRAGLPASLPTWRGVAVGLALLGAIPAQATAPLLRAATGTAAPAAPHRLTQAISSTATGGNWSNPTTWVGGVVPTGDDDVTIAGGATVTLDVTAEAGSLTINSSGTLVASAIASHVLEVGGSVLNNGTLDLSASSTIGSDLRFVGAGSVTFSGTGTTDLFSMTLAKSVRDDVVEMNLPTLAVKGSLTVTDGFLLTRTIGQTPVNDMTGTLKLSGTATRSNRVFGNAASYILPATGGFWLDNPNFTVTAQTGSPNVAGLLRISAGTYNVGIAVNNSISFGTNAVYTQEGGTLNMAGRFGSFTSGTAAATMTFNLSGGTMNINTVGNTTATPSFGVNGTTTISGGTINLVQRSTSANTPLDYYVNGTYNYTGGTVNIGTAATATTFDFRVRGTFPNMTIDNTTNPKTAVLQGQTNVYGTTLITPGANLNLSGARLLQLGATFTNNGILTGVTANSNLYFVGSVPQTLGGTGTGTTIRSITVDNSGGGLTLTMPVVVARLNMYTGNLNGATNLTIGDGTFLGFVVQFGAPVPSTSGSITAAPNFNIGTGALQLTYGPELTPRTTGFEVPPTRVVDSFTINNPAGVTLAGGNLLVNASGVSPGSLVLTSGILTTSAANKLTLGTAAATIPNGSATSYVRGPLGITVNSATAVSRTFAVGDAAGWRPVVVSGITTATAQVFTATVVNGATGGTGVAPITGLNPTRYVRLENTANLPATARVQLSYGAGDVPGTIATAVVAQAPTAAGAYASIGGAAANTPTTGLVSTLDLVPGNDYFVLANTESVTLPDLTISTGSSASPVAVPAGTYDNITVTGTGVARLGGAVVVNTALTVAGTLDTNCQGLTGGGSFTLAAGGTLAICDASGLTASGATGAVRTTGPRSFSSDASYVYTGTTTQQTGTGLPAQVRNLTVSKAGGTGPLILGQPLAVRQVLAITDAGSLDTNSQPLTLLSDATGTALLANTSTGRVIGNLTVQRYIDDSRNAGLGYRHLAAPVNGQTVAAFASGGTAQVVNPAYNTATVPGLVTPFPTVFRYDQARLATSPATSLSAFDKGWLSPGALTDNAPAGITGFTVQLPGASTLSFTGTAFQTDGFVALSRASGATAADAGWNFIGNPYAAPLDMSTVTAGQRQNLDAAVYVWESTSQYGGQYRAYVNGVGAGDPLIGSSQAFWMRVSQGQTSGTLTFAPANRVTDYARQAPVRRGAADQRPQLTLALSSPGLTDHLSLYAQAGATPAFDGEFDAAKLANPHGLNLASLTTSGEQLAIDGRPAFAAASSIPLFVGVPAAGRYTLTAASLVNLAGTRAELVDNLTGTRTLLGAGTSYAFRMSGPTAPGRFWLNLTPAAAPLATNTALEAQVLAYPNPAHGQLTVVRPAGKVAAATLLNSLGQTVRTLALPTAETTVDLRGLAVGVYTLRLTLDGQPVAKRVVID